MNAFSSVYQGIASLFATPEKPQDLEKDDPSNADQTINAGKDEEDESSSSSSEDEYQLDIPGSTINTMSTLISNSVGNSPASPQVKKNVASNVPEPMEISKRLNQLTDTAANVVAPEPVLVPVSNAKLSPAKITTRHSVIDKSKQTKRKAINYTSIIRRAMRSGCSSFDDIVDWIDENEDLPPNYPERVKLNLKKNEGKLWDRNGKRFTSKQPLRKPKVEKPKKVRAVTKKIVTKKSTRPVVVVSPISHDITGPSIRSPRWQYYDNGWFDYDVNASREIEKVYDDYTKNGSNFDVRSVYSGKYHYMVDFTAMRQTNIDHENHTIRNIRRII